MTEVKDNILLLLGAGFSAHFGLPVMSNFLIKARDLLRSDSAFEKVIDPVLKRHGDLHKVKSYVDSDLLNIEEILSILEMEAFTTGDDETPRQFKRFINSVIRDYTPTYNFILKKEKIRVNPHELFNSPDRIWNDTRGFFTALFNRNISVHQNAPGFCLSIDPNEHNQERVGIISLNYDLIIENFLNKAKDQLEPSGTGKFPSLIFQADNDTDPYLDRESIPLAKIHGSVGGEGESIVSPTWNKVTDINVRPVWRLAKNLLKYANHILFLGYSIPITDTYFRYLLNCSLKDNTHIKTIYALCLDNFEGTVEDRYKSLFCYPPFQFINSKVKSLFLKFGYPTSLGPSRSTVTHLPDSIIKAVLESFN